MYRGVFVENHKCQHGLVTVLFPLVAVVFSYLLINTHHAYPNLAQPQPTAHTPTFTEPSNPSITEAPPPAYQFHERFANYSEKKKQSDGLPPYNPPPYDVSIKETKCEPLNIPQD